MSIASRMTPYTLYRSASTLDAYGIMSATPVSTATIHVSVTKNIPTHDNTFPQYDMTSYIGITKYDGVKVGDKLTSGTVTYLVKDVGSRGTIYQPLFLEKL